MSLVALRTFRSLRANITTFGARSIEFAPAQLGKVHHTFQSTIFGEWRPNVGSEPLIISEHGQF